MRVFAVSGYSGTGKTALVEAIIKSLVERGHSVATIKSSKHKAGPDQGTDSWRHMQAGAAMTVFLGPSKKATSFKERIGPDELVELYKHDFLIIEGMKSADIPKFWCVGDAEMNSDDVPVNTQAIVSWSDKTAVPGLDFLVFNTHEIEKLVQIVREKAVDISEID